jgi:hypothetical protein
VYSVQLKEPIFGVVTPVAASGWPLRNFLIYLKTKLKLSKATILQFRTDKSNTADISPSDIIEVDLLGDLELTKEECTASGWERTGDGKLAPRFLNLEGTMDPTKLAASAVDLNLKLMRWRLLPNLDLEKVSKTKCLLLGAGTLGCNVARNLLVRSVFKNISVSFNILRILRRLGEFAKSLLSIMEKYRTPTLFDSGYTPSKIPRKAETKQLLLQSA